MQTRIVLLGLTTLAFSPLLCGAETLTYEHEAEPLLSITFPDHWYVDTDFFDEARAAGVEDEEAPVLRIVEAMPGDDSKLWFGVWVAPRVSTLERGLEYIASLDGELFTDVKASAPADAEIGGMTAKTLHGTALRLGEEVEFAVALFSPRSEVIAVALYVGQPQTWEKHRAELEAIVDSLRPAKS